MLIQDIKNTSHDTGYLFSKGIGNNPLLIGTNFYKMKTPQQKEIICGIYKITNPKGRIYIGQSKDCLSRVLAYKYLHCKQQPRIYNSIKKYGWEAHTFEVIHVCEESELNKWEKHYVDLLQTFNTEHGMNLRDGGGNTSIFSEEVRKKMGDKRRGKSCSQETKSKIGEKNRGERNGMFGKGEKVAGHKNGMYGKPKTQEARNKLSKTNSGKKRPPFSEQWRKNIGKAQLGKKLSEEHKRKISIGGKGKNLGQIHSKEHRLKNSLAHKGRPGWNKGKQLSEETKSKIRAKRKLQVITEEHKRKISLAMKIVHQKRKMAKEKT